MLGRRPSLLVLCLNVRPCWYAPVPAAGCAANAFCIKSAMEGSTSGEACSSHAASEGPSLQRSEHKVLVLSIRQPGCPASKLLGCQCEAAVDRQASR